MEKSDESEEERARRLTWKQKRRQRAKMQALPCELRNEINEYERAAASKAKNGRLKKRPYPHAHWGIQDLDVFGERVRNKSMEKKSGIQTLLTSWNSFIVRFAILLTVCCTWLTVPKAHATPTNSNAHVSPVSSKVIEMHMKHTLRICTPSWYLINSSIHITCTESPMPLLDLVVSYPDHT